jgi:hypothetical protein
MVIIDITQQNGSIVAETTKESIAQNLLQRNPKLYRAAGLSPFGDIYLGHHRGPSGSSPLTTEETERTFSMRTTRSLQPPRSSKEGPA